LPTLVSYLSQFMSLLPGDVITRARRAAWPRHQAGAKYLKVGDVVSWASTGWAARGNGGAFEMKRYVLTLDLRTTRARSRSTGSITARLAEVQKSLRRIGVRAMDIYALGRRLTMVMDTRDGFDLRRSFAAHVASDPRCAEWEALMKSYQEPPPERVQVSCGRGWTRVPSASGRRKDAAVSRRVQ